MTLNSIQNEKWWQLAEIKCFIFKRVLYLFQLKIILFQVTKMFFMVLVLVIDNLTIAKTIKKCVDINAIT